MPDILELLQERGQSGDPRSWEMDSPELRLVQPLALGNVVESPEVGGLHHHYEQLAA
jgi:hypothetical protein